MTRYLTDAEVSKHLEETGLFKPNDAMPYGMEFIMQQEDPVSVLKREAERNHRPIQSIKHYRTTATGSFKFDFKKSKPLPRWPGFNHVAVSGCRAGRVEPINDVYAPEDIRWFKYSGPGPMFRATLGSPKRPDRQKTKASARGRKKALKYGWLPSTVSFMFSTTKQGYAPRFKIHWTGYRVNMTVVCDAHDEFCFSNTQLEFKGNASKR